MARKRNAYVLDDDGNCNTAQGTTILIMCSLVFSTYAIQSFFGPRSKAERDVHTANRVVLDGSPQASPMTLSWCGLPSPRSYGQARSVWYRNRSYDGNMVVRKATACGMSSATFHRVVNFRLFYCRVQPRSVESQHDTSSCSLCLPYNLDYTCSGTPCAILYSSQLSHPALTMS